MNGDLQEYLGLDKKGHNDSYEARNEGINSSELLFEEVCKAKGIECHRLGFDEKQDKVSKFYKVHPLIRGLPDYLIVRSNPVYVHVKGTNRFKLDDLISYSAFEELFCSKESKLRVAFCIGKSVKFKSMQDIREMLTGLVVEEFPSDGKQFFSLPL